MKGARARSVGLGAMFAGLAVVAVPREASAFCRSTTVAIAPDFLPSTTRCWDQGYLLYWRSACVGYSLQRNASRVVPYDDAQSIVARSFGRWAQATCAGVESGGSRVGIDVRDLGPVECTEPVYNTAGQNQNVIVFRDEVWPHEASSNTLAITTVTFNPDTGEILDADMEINTADHEVTTVTPVPAGGYDLASIVTHESGHFLGLAHSGEPTATMYAQYNHGSSAMRNLTPDDVSGICEVYRSDGRRSASDGAFVDRTACDPTPRRGFISACEETKSSTCGKSTVAATKDDDASGARLVLGAVALGSLVALRRRRG